MELDLKVEQGTFLAAGPDLLDPNFMHTVVLMCQHVAEGAYGLVVNRRSSYSSRDVLSEHPLFGQLDVPIHVGGPVGLEMLQILHRAPDRISGGVPIGEGLVLGGDLEDAGRWLAEDRPAAERSVRLVLGYSGWAAGQLELELLTGSWLPAPADPALVFRPDLEAVWRDVVRSLGRDAQGLEDQPPHPRWN
jgi:putative transcriptional regulator